MEINVSPWSTLTTPSTLPYYYTISSGTSTVLATLTDADKEALKAMMREVITEVLDERERKANEEKPHDEYWRF